MKNKDIKDRLRAGIHERFIGGLCSEALDTIENLEMEVESLEKKLAHKSWEGVVDRQGGARDWTDDFYNEWKNE